MSKFPPVASLVPHSGGMIFVGEVLEHDETHTTCAIDVGAGPFCASDGSVGAWVGVEYMAQCVAAHGGLVARAAGEEPRIGLLLGSRRVTLHQPRYSRGERLIARAKRVWGKEDGLVAFDCSLRGEDGGLLAEARLNCFLTDEGAFEERPPPELGGERERRENG